MRRRHRVHAFSSLPHSLSSFACEPLAHSVGHCLHGNIHILLHAFREHGAASLKSERRGPRTNYRRTQQVVRQVIRHRFLDPEASAEVIAQKLRQCGEQISIRSVQRIISEFGLQKKTLCLQT